MTEASRTMRYARALGWAAFAAAPILLAALAVIASRPSTPESTITYAAIAAWIAGALAFGASLVHRRRLRAGKVAGALAALVVLASLAALVIRPKGVSKPVRMTGRSTPVVRTGISATDMRGGVVSLDERERAELVRREVEGRARLVHPHLELSLPVTELMEPAPQVERESESAGGHQWARAHRIWAWRAADTEIVMDLSRAPSASPEALREATDAIAARLAASSPDVRRSSAAGELSSILESRLTAGGSALARVALFEHGGRAYRLVVTVITREPQRWRRWLDAISLPTD